MSTLMLLSLCLADPSEAVVLEPIPVVQPKGAPTERRITELLDDISEAGDDLETIPSHPNVPVRFTGSSWQTWRDRVYRPANAFDLDYRTAWVENDRDDGLGEWVALDFERAGGDFKAWGFLVVSGFAKNNYMFRRNNRPRRATLTLSCKNPTGTSTQRFDLRLRDGRMPQVFRVPAEMRIVLIGACALRLTVDRVYRGTHYRDTSLAELRLLLCRANDLRGIGVSGMP